MIKKFLDYSLVFIFLLLCFSNNVFALDLSGNLDKFNSPSGTNAVASTDSTNLSLNISNYYVSVMEPNGDGSQLEQFTYRTNPFYTSNITYSRWLPRRIGFDGNTSTSFNLSYLYTLSYRFNYPSSTDFFDWRTYMNYARPKIYGSTSDLFSCSIIANTSSYTDIKCTFKRSNADNYFFFYFEFFDTPNALKYQGIPSGFGPQLSFSNISLAYSLSAEDIQVEQNDIIINQNNQTNQKLDDLNNNITNDNVSGVEDSFSRFEDFLDDNSTITQLITLPVTLYSSILQGVSNSCSSFNLGSLYGESLVLPCVNIGNYLGSTLWGMIDLIISGFAIYSISKKLIKIFNNFSSMKDGDVIDD